jgi:hypothetical protein
MNSIFTHKKMKVGKPLKYSVQDVEDIITDYFTNTPESKQTVTGLAMVFGSKVLMNDYQKRDGYSHIITFAKLKIENLYEQCLRDKNPTGAIFALKNFGWADKQEHAITGELKTTGIDYSKLSDATLRELANAGKPDAGA